MQPLDGTESLVIDCSVTMAWYFKDEATPYSNAVCAALATERAAVPVLWPLEVANVLLMGERRKRFHPGTGLEMAPITRCPAHRRG
jgi:hypothetical protein